MSADPFGGEPEVEPWGAEMTCDDGMMVEERVPVCVKPKGERACGRNAKMTPPESPHINSAGPRSFRPTGAKQFNPFSRTTDARQTHRLAEGRAGFGRAMSSTSSVEDTDMEMPDNGIPTPTRMDSPSSPRRRGSFSQADLDLAFMAHGAFEKLASMDFGAHAASAGHGRLGLSPAGFR